MKGLKFNFKRFSSFSQGDRTLFSMEQRLFNVMGFYAGIIGIGATIINIIIDARKDLIFLAAVTSMVSWFIFYLSRFASNIKLGKWIFTFFLFFIFSYFFFINNGSRGPILFLYMAFFLYLLFVWNRRERIFFTVIFYLNITLFFLVELKFPGATKPYATEYSRLIDLYLSYYMFVAALGAILMFAKNGYIYEKKRAEKSDELKTSFLANMSHEIRTPMNAILGFTQLLQDDLPKQQKEAYLKIIQDNSKNLLRIIEDIIDVSKIEAGELSIKKEPFDPVKVINEVSMNFKQLLKEYPDRKVDIRTGCPEKSILIFGDGARVKQVLFNLVSNAVKYTNKGYIDIGYVHEPEVIRFYVNDTGPGIRQEHMDDIFERFRKIEAEDSVKVHPGTGIGLSICKNLVQLMGGQIWVESEFGKGTRFYFTIPCAEAPREHVEKYKRGSRKQKNSDELKGKRILVAEDERTNFILIKRVMENSGAEILHARNGKEAVEIFANHGNIDIVLMDILMPEMNGIDATRVIKTIDTDIPVIAQTALAMEGDAARVLAAGCDDYISKPLKMSDLLSRVIQMLHVTNTSA
ncbi:MAG: response regulator [Bacteroidales bacterium]|nr:response regulator [Bacteroidales bacterium]